MAITPNVVAGQTISQWTQDWWTWAVNLTDDANPFTHPEGNFASVNNDGPVFFIAGGVPGFPNASQTINVPFGTPLLVPLINFIDTAPEVTHNKHFQDTHIPGNVTTTPAIHATENSNVKSFDGSVTSLFATIDEKPITDLFKNLVDTSFFSMGTAKVGTLATDVYELASAGTTMDPSKSGGYWLMIDNLSPGPHTLHFGGHSDGFDLLAALEGTRFHVDPFSIDVTDTITVGNDNNSITAGNGNNSITVGSGNNIIHAGTGNDTFIFNSPPVVAAAAVAGASPTTAIFGYHTGDTLNVSAFAGLLPSGSSLHFSAGATNFDHTAGDIIAIADTAGTGTMIQVDTTGTGHSVTNIHLVGVTVSSIDGSNFHL